LEGWKVGGLEGWKVGKVGRLEGFWLDCLKVEKQHSNLLTFNLETF
jgi:hypothetical protein